MDFGDTVDGSGALHAQVRGGVPGRGGPECANGAGDKEAQAVFCRNVQDVVQT